MKIPKKYEERFYSLERQLDLADGKYILYFMNGWSWNGYGSVPVRSKKEALEFLKEATKEDQK